jgi:rRNA processing protein Gar1
MEKIGYVYDIIGPTKSPFILIKPRKDMKVVEEELFVVNVHAGGRKGKGSRKGKGKRGRIKGDRKGRNP